MQDPCWPCTLTVGGWYQNNQDCTRQRTRQDKTRRNETKPEHRGTHMSAGLHQFVTRGFLMERSYVWSEFFSASATELCSRIQNIWSISSGTAMWICPQLKGDMLSLKKKSPYGPITLLISPLPDPKPELVLDPPDTPFAGKQGQIEGFCIYSNLI